LGWLRRGLKLGWLLQATRLRGGRDGHRGLRLCRGTLRRRQEVKKTRLRKSIDLIIAFQGTNKLPVSLHSGDGTTGFGFKADSHANKGGSCGFLGPFTTRDRNNYTCKVNATRVAVSRGRGSSLDGTGVEGMGQSRRSPPKLFRNAARGINWGICICFRKIAGSNKRNESLGLSGYRSTRCVNKLTAKANYIKSGQHDGIQQLILSIKTREKRGFGTKKVLAKMLI
jgi:hypothetical protein